MYLVLHMKVLIIEIVNIVKKQMYTPRLTIDLREGEG